MNTTSVVAPPNSPHSRESTLPPYKSSAGTPVANTPVDQAAIRQALTQLINDPRLTQLSFDVQGLGATTFDVQRLPLAVVQALVIMGLTITREIDHNDEWVA